MKQKKLVNHFLLLIAVVFVTQKLDSNTNTSPDPNEAAYIRPSVLNPPKDCEPKLKMKPSHRVTSCMGDSGGPLVMKGENGEDLLVGNTSWGSGSCSDGYPAAWSNNRNPEVQSWIK